MRCRAKTNLKDKPWRTDDDWFHQEGYGGASHSTPGEASFPKHLPFFLQCLEPLLVSRLRLSIASIWSNEPWVTFDDFSLTRAAGAGDFGAVNWCSSPLSYTWKEMDILKSAGLFVLRLRVGS